MAPVLLADWFFFLWRRVMVSAISKRFVMSF